MAKTNGFESSTINSSESNRLFTFLSVLAQNSELLTLQPWADRVLDNLEEDQVHKAAIDQFERTLIRVFPNHKRALGRGHVESKAGEKADQLLAFFEAVATISSQNETQSWLAYTLLHEYQRVMSSLPDSSPEDDQVSAERRFSVAFEQVFLGTRPKKGSW